ncbi:MAG: hypothetical protein QNJ19_16920 [Woeseiaceae bacterium]|nr:hypothetical protein [Woeseiaceae bacterium]
MFRAIRIAVLLFILLFVGLDTWLTQARSTDWDNSLWVKVYPINADGSEASRRYIETLTVNDFDGVEEFLRRESTRYGRPISEPVKMRLGEPVRSQPPSLGPEPNVLDVMLWSLKMRLWASNETSDQDNITPDVRIFLRYHSPEIHLSLENSVGIEKGMFGIVNAYAGRLYRGRNNVIIAHEFLHTLGATDKYDPATGQPLPPDGLADPELSPLYPQSRAEIMGGRIALAENDAVIPKSLNDAIIGPLTAREIGLSN